MKPAIDNRDIAARNTSKTLFTTMVVDDNAEVIEQVIFFAFDEVRVFEVSAVPGKKYDHLRIRRIDYTYFFVERISVDITGHPESVTWKADTLNGVQISPILNSWFSKEITLGEFELTKKIMVGLIMNPPLKAANFKQQP